MDKKTIAVITFIVYIVSVVLAFNLGKGNISVEDTGSITESETSVTEIETTVLTTAEPTTQFDIVSFRNSCIEVTYEEVMRNPDNYINKAVCVRGRVWDIGESQQSDGSFSCSMELATDYSIGDNFAVYYTLSKGESHYIEDDTAEVYGIFNGIVTAQTALGSSFSLPSITAKQIILR